MTRCQKCQHKNCKCKTINVCRVPGATGPTGPCCLGPQGPTGPTGIGFTGPTGATGPCCPGFTGATGPAGSGSSITAFSALETPNTVTVPTAGEVIVPITFGVENTQPLIGGPVVPVGPAGAFTGIEITEPGCYDIQYNLNGFPISGPQGTCHINFETKVLLTSSTTFEAPILVTNNNYNFTMADLIRPGEVVPVSSNLDDLLCTNTLTSLFGPPPYVLTLAAQLINSTCNVQIEDGTFSVTQVSSSV